jgi:hypothetical protein
MQATVTSAPSMTWEKVSSSLSMLAIAPSALAYSVMTCPRRRAIRSTSSSPKTPAQ